MLVNCGAIRILKLGLSWKYNRQVLGWLQWDRGEVWRMGLRFSGLYALITERCTGDFGGTEHPRWLCLWV